MPWINKLPTINPSMKASLYLTNTLTKASFADFIVVGLLRFLREVDEQIFNKFVSHDPAFQQLYEACKPWLERNDH